MLEKIKNKKLLFIILSILIILSFILYLFIDYKRKEPYRLIVESINECDFNYAIYQTKKIDEKDLDVDSKMVRDAYFKYIDENLTDNFMNSNYELKVSHGEIKKVRELGKIFKYNTKSDTKYAYDHIVVLDEIYENLSIGTVIEKIRKNEYVVDYMTREFVNFINDLSNGNYLSANNYLDTIDDIRYDFSDEYGNLGYKVRLICINFYEEAVNLYNAVINGNSNEFEKSKEKILDIWHKSLDFSEESKISADKLMESIQNYKKNREENL